MHMHVGMDTRAHARTWQSGPPSPHKPPRYSNLSSLSVLMQSNMTKASEALNDPRLLSFVVVRSPYVKKSRHNYVQSQS